jgi:molybdopterin-biosynthesis enzyme MoeA-like protein
VVVSRTVRVDGTGEGVLAAPLEAIAKAHPALSLGSYPFWDPTNLKSGFGSNLVVRGRDAGEVEAAVGQLLAALAALGVADVRRLDAEGDQG